MAVLAKIRNPKTREYVEVACSGCLCHGLPVLMGELIQGCCGECGCPKTEEGFAKRKQEDGSFLLGSEPVRINQSPCCGVWNAHALDCEKGTSNG